MKKTLLLLVTLITATIAFAQTEIDGIYYNLNNSNQTAEVTSGSNRYSGDITIPEKVTHNATEYSITSIGNGAFQVCSSLTSVSIPNSVTYIGSFAFSYCSSLTSIEVNANNQNYASIDGVLYDKDVTILICCPGGKTSITIPNSVTSIGSFAFSYCKALTSITIPNSVTSIGEDAFSSCKALTSITIPNSVTSIGSYAFSSCLSLTSITIEATTPPTLINGLLGYSGIIYIPDNTLWAYIVDWGIDYTFINNENTLTIHVETPGTLADKIFDAGQRPAFVIKLIVTGTLNDDDFTCMRETMTSLVDVDLSAITNTTGINFENKSNLLKILLPENLTSIGNSAFRGCSSLTSITIPNSVTSIGEAAFYYCESLTSITIPNSVTSIGSSAFSNCSSLTSISIPNSVTSIGESAFSWCSSLTSITIPNSVTSIESYAFSDCDALTSITIPNSVTSIGGWAFSYCSSLTSITIPNSVTFIGNYAFYNCDALTSISIPNSVTSIEESAFSGCSSLTSITIPNSVTSIGNSAFYYCESLTSITIPNSVTSIGNSTFFNCSSLSSITIPNSIIFIGDDAFRNCSSLTSITIGNSVTSIGEDAFYECSSLTSITIPNSVISIDESAFEDCNKLRTVQIGKSIETIEGNAFAGCTAIYSITINAAIPPIIDATTFTDVSHTAQIKVPCNAVAAYQASNYWNKFSNYIETPYSLTIVSNDNTMGNAVVIKQPTCQDIIAQVQAQALPGYEFVKWSDGFTENPHTIYVTSDTTITAEFRKINEEPEDKHNIFIVESADKTQGDVTITITANAIEGFVFSHWSDGSTENPRNVTLEDNIELYAYFKVAENTNIETSKISSANIYTTNNTLHIEGATTDYHILDAAGRLIYSGNATTLTLPRGIYLVTMGGEVEKIVL